MKKLIASFCVLVTLSCNSTSEGGYKKAEDAQDAGRQFIRASLDGDYDKAAFYLLKDSTNLLLFETLKTDFKGRSSEVKSSYKAAAIRPVSIVPENDSTTLYKYYHTAKPTDTTILRIVRYQGEWLVDLKSVIKM